MQLLPITLKTTLPPGCAEVRELVTGVIEAMHQLYDRSGFQPPWLGYFAVQDGKCVGTCAFKSPPRDNHVEIAYLTFPDYERMGIATDMARELVSIALGAQPRILISAQTLPEHNASTAVLRKVGFSLVGEVEHPEDGLVWEWQLVNTRS